MRGQLMSVTGHTAGGESARGGFASRSTRPDAPRCDEYGYGLGSPGGILVLAYRSEAPLEFAYNREDFLHQLYWSPDLLSARADSSVVFAGGDTGFWARRTVGHEIHAAGEGTLYRICLREIPPHLSDLRYGAVSFDPDIRDLVRRLGAPDFPADAAPEARARIVESLQPAETAPDHRAARGNGQALSVARALARRPGDPTRLDEWAARLHTSVKTLQRDFEREFGMSFTTWRTDLRLRAARVLLQHQSVTSVAHTVGYATPSAFVAAFSQRFGRTPGRFRQLPAPR